MNFVTICLCSCKDEIELHHSGRYILPVISINAARHAVFIAKVSKNQISDKPNTADSSKYHRLRVFYQVQCWLENAPLDPKSFGIKKEKEQ